MTSAAPSEHGEWPDDPRDPVHSPLISSLEPDTYWQDFRAVDGFRVAPERDGAVASEHVFDSYEQAREAGIRLAMHAGGGTFSVVRVTVVTPAS